MAVLTTACLGYKKHRLKGSVMIWTKLVLLALMVLPCAHASLREEQIDVSVKVNDAYGKAIGQTIKVTNFADDANPQPAPVLVLNHGRARLGLVRYLDAPRFLVQRDFIVAVPTRIGYGVRGGADIEDSGLCNAKRYPPAFAVAADQTLAVLAAMRLRRDAASDRSVVMGQTYGRATAVAALNPQGVQAGINFASGGGGNPKTQPQRPCAPQALERVYGDYGKSARLPMLWIHTENDMYFGAKMPRQWRAFYVAAGGQAQLVLFPPQGDDGHLLFNRFSQLWQPKVAEFLDA